MPATQRYQFVRIAATSAFFPHHRRMTCNIPIKPLYVKPRDAAVILGVSEASVRNYVADGILPARRLGHRILIPISALAPKDEK